jgi:hypothetical protein
MSDFFASLTQGNVRFPDARIDGDGPLPTTLSGPAGILGDPDGKYNFNDALLTSIAPYAGPKQNRISSDRNYQQIPHRKQFPVPPIFVPEPGHTAEDSFMMSHPIDMGDVCFIVNLRNKHSMLSNTSAPSGKASIHSFFVHRDLPAAERPQFELLSITHALGILAQDRGISSSITPQP